MSRRRGSAMALKESEVVAARGMVSIYSHTGICQVLFLGGPFSFEGRQRPLYCPDDFHALTNRFPGSRCSAGLALLTPPLYSSNLLGSPDRRSLLLQILGMERFMTPLGRRLLERSCTCSPPAEHTSTRRRLQKAVSFASIRWKWIRTPFPWCLEEKPGRWRLRFRFRRGRRCGLRFC